jgi:uncharacterized protein (DUF58 family)
VGDFAADYRKYLDPKTLAKIAALDLRARLVVEGFVSGMHRSPYRGYAVEFAEHREYTQGDDTRHLDWKVFGRTDRYYIKEYEEETNLACYLVVDCSESMKFRSDPEGLTKHEYGIAVAASLAYLALQQQDSVGLAAFDEQVTRFVRPANQPAQWKTIVRVLEEAGGMRKTSIRSVLDDLAERIHRRALIVLISDLLDRPKEILAGLRRLRYRRNEIIVLNVLDHAELEFPVRGPTLFKGLEAQGRLLAEPNALRRRYLAEVRAFIQTLRRGCRDLRVDYEVFDTSKPLDVMLSSYLATRSSRLLK